MPSWFYAINDQKHGPVSAAEIARMSRGGGLVASHLIWREGMPEWLPLHQVAGHAFAEAGTNSEVGEEATSALAVPVETAICAISHRVLPAREMVPYGDRWIDPAYKDTFVQELMESGGAPDEGSQAIDLIPVGFWWRALAVLVDSLALAVPSLLCFLPQILTSISLENATASESDSAPLWAVLSFVTGAIGYIGNIAITAFYYTWMLSKYQATLGKMSIGAVVVNRDGTAFGNGKAFGRWACQAFLNGAILGISTLIAFMVGPILMILIGVAGSAASGTDEGTGAAMAGGFLVMLIVILIGSIAGLFPYWMAAFDQEKRTLHDRICSTLVVKKP